MAEFLNSLDAGTQKALRWLGITLFVMLGTLLLANVFLRLINDLSIFLTKQGFAGASGFIKTLVPIVSLHWFDEIVELCFASMVFYGAAALWGTKGHFSVGDWISPRLPGERLRAFYKMLISLTCVVFLAVFFWFSLSLTVRATELSTVFQIPKAVFYSCMPISSMIMLLYSLCDVCVDVRNIFVKPGGQPAHSREQGYQSL